MSHRLLNRRAVDVGWSAFVASVTGFSAVAVLRALPAGAPLAVGSSARSMLGVALLLFAGAVVATGVVVTVRRRRGHHLPGPTPVEALGDAPIEPRHVGAPDGAPPAGERRRLHRRNHGPEEGGDPG